MITKVLGTVFDSELLVNLQEKPLRRDTSLSKMPGGWGVGG